MSPVDYDPKIATLSSASSKAHPKSDLRIGISGWTYVPWRGEFYPKKWPQARELEYASRQINSIEINGTFYALQRPSIFEKWYAATPDDFVFSVKVPRFITHIRRLRDCKTPVANFFASGVLALKEKLGPIFLQLPPTFQFDAEVLATFFDLLPRSTAAAAALAKKHDAKIKSPALTAIDRDRPLRYAIEVRHESFACKPFIQLLRKHEIALVIAETAGKWPFMEDVTADFVYVRLHGDEAIYESGYTRTALDAWAKKIRSWSTGKLPRGAKTISSAAGHKRASRDVFIYFDNDLKVKSPRDAKALSQRLGILWADSHADDF